IYPPGSPISRRRARRSVYGASTTTRSGPTVRWKTGLQPSTRSGARRNCPLKLSTNALSMGLPARMKCAASVGPAVEHPPRELRAVVADDHGGQRWRLCDALEHADDAEAGQRGIDLRRDRLAAVVVDEYTSIAISFGQHGWARCCDSPRQWPTQGS